ncbi:MAG: MFS transporter [Pseudomonadota bacterium]
MLASMLRFSADVIRRRPAPSKLPPPSFSGPRHARANTSNRPSPVRRRALPALLEPLRHRRFRQLWLANLAANPGRWVQAFAAAWLVASMSSPSPSPPCCRCMCATCCICRPAASAA